MNDDRKSYPLACGQHFSAKPAREGDACYICDKNADLRRRGLLQADGTPWSAVRGRVVGGGPVPPKGAQS